jgi:hypothetical protein
VPSRGDRPGQAGLRRAVRALGFEGSTPRTPKGPGAAQAYAARLTAALNELTSASLRGYVVETLAKEFRIPVFSRACPIALSTAWLWTELRSMARDDHGGDPDSCIQHILTGREFTVMYRHPEEILLE